MDKINSDKPNISLSLANPNPLRTDAIQKFGLILGLLGLLILLLAWAGIAFPNNAIALYSSLALISIGTVIYSRRAYLSLPEGIKNNGVWFKSMSSRGVLGWATGILLTGFYIVLYWYAEYLGQGVNGAANTGLVALFDPLSRLLKGQPASQWFVYGTLYTVAILALGYKYILKYRHNRYQVVRTISVMFFQLGFAFLIPEFIARLNSDLPYNDFKNMWPLNYYNFDGYRIKSFLNGGNLGLFMLLFGIAMIFIISPVLTYFYGKRWYCSWVCGCGGLAETAGDSYRHLSSKKVSAWKLERWSIHLVMIISVLMTLGVINTYLTNNPDSSIFTRSQFTWGLAIFLSLLIALVFVFKRGKLNRGTQYIVLSMAIVSIGAIVLNAFSTSNQVLFIDSHIWREQYGFLIGAAFSGVIGVGFYPLLGNRVWCRFGCPMAAILGLQQKLFSKFRITTNGGQCISCGNCSTYCEMGIDVRAYAQKGQNIVRASCVGCGVCSAVCPRGVLKLENDGPGERVQENPSLLGSADGLVNQLKK
jgi:polyferredoxin